MRIRIVAFHDGKGNSDAYRKFDSIEKAVEFLMEICMRIRKIGGRATILEEKFYFEIFKLLFRWKLY